MRYAHLLIVKEFYKKGFDDNKNWHTNKVIAFSSNKKLQKALKFYREQIKNIDKDKRLVNAKQENFLLETKKIAINEELNKYN